MATWQIFNDFKERLGDETHDLTADTLKLMLSNTAPALSNSLKSDLTEIAGGNGYTAGGDALTYSYTETGGTATLATTADQTFTASGGAIAQFRYLVIYNDTAVNDELIGYIDYGVAVDLADTEPFTLTAGSIFTLA